MPGLIAWKRSEIANFRRRMEDLCEQFFGDLSSRHFLPVSGPFCDWQIREDENQFVLKLELPGLKAEDFEIQLDGDVLTVRAQKEEIHPPESITRPVRTETHFATVRSIRLPRQVNRDEIEARYADGVLIIILPKVEKTTFKVQVKG